MKINCMVFETCALQEFYVECALTDRQTDRPTDDTTPNFSLSSKTDKTIEYFEIRETLFLTQCFHYLTVDSEAISWTNSLAIYARKK